GLPWRAQTAAVAVWTAATSLPMLALGAIQSGGETVERLVVAIGAFFCVVAGIGVIAGFRLLDRAFTPRESF
ncbi:MAG TPA: hypothetical protein VMV18_08800, partial [bacterium]|nr:hypothetical protein [bacterium]